MVNQSKSAIQEFIAFIKGFGVIGLAIGVVIGKAVSDLVAALVTTIINPILGYVVGGINFSSIKLGNLLVGDFISALINFLILVAVVWIGVKVIVGRMLSEKERADMGM
jgi:large conductance mechanosensitive channel